MKGVCTFLYWHLDFIWIWSSILYSSSSFPFVSWDAVLELGLDSKLSLEFLSDMTLTTWVSMVVWGYGAPFITDNFLLFAILNFHLLWLSFPFNCFLFPVLTYAVASSLYFFFYCIIISNISVYLYIFSSMKVKICSYRVKCWTTRWCVFMSLYVIYLRLYFSCNFSLTSRAVLGAPIS